MVFKQLKKDFTRNKLITVVLVLFILLSAMLALSALSIITELAGSLNNLFEKGSTPYFIQKHVGDIDQSEIDRFTAGSNLVKEQQTSELINIDNSNIYLGDKGISEDGSVMDNGFTMQNEKMDFLLDLRNELVQVSDGEIGVPVYHMQERGLALGDMVLVSNGTFQMQFTITDFVRDGVNNPSVLNSKRFVVSEKDYNTLKRNLGNIDNIEYMIEYQLTDLNQTDGFVNDYQEANLPQAGPSATYSLLKLMNGLSDGLIAGVIILVSILLVIVAMLCLRFTILTTMEEDYKEIGVMKAIGIATKNIKQIYLVKYIAIGVIGCVGGYLLSLTVSKTLCSNILLYMGVADKTIFTWIAPFLAAGIIFLIAVGFCYFVLRRFEHISAVQALSKAGMTKKRIKTGGLSLSNGKLPVNLFLGVKDIMVHFKMYLLLVFTFFICTFIIFVPLNFLNTTKAPEFVTYMGIGKTDIRIDLQHIEKIDERFQEITNYLKSDSDIEKSAGFITSKFRVYDKEGFSQSINIESGDFSVFPLQYLEGGSPVHDLDIALSSLNAQTLGVTLGDKLPLEGTDGEVRQMNVCGIYQDLTNGGKTAKALLPYNPDTVLWYVVNLDVKEGISIQEKTGEYADHFDFAQVSDTEKYRLQTFSTTIDQLQLVTILAIGIAVLMLILITSLFLRMLLAKDSSQITIMRSLGFSQKDIQKQYITRVLTVLIIGIILGTVVSNTGGESLVSGIFAMMGASKIDFIINPIQAYVICPIGLLIIATVTTVISTLSVKKTSISELNAE